ncbi:prolyl aminopeptidase [Isoalcanivorax indicus]|uniref:prolyl aminopeptidase n=1 Tax=Isoalcanivorax indicus TaxID=2202653 RepID=UPI000DB99131|nr:prolyl aminopeptidase [Isoalcanivorax indicus]
MSADLTPVSRHALYPALAPWDQRWLDVGDGHRLYIEQSGNPHGEPVLVVHGGPGGGCSPRMRRYFDPRHWRIILFDQRGAGQSQPSGSLTANTTPDLVADMERIRVALGVERWLLFGGSWGVTLALRYGQCHPQRVAGMVLRGVFLCRQQDIDWLYREGGASRIFPDAWARFRDALPAAAGADLLTRYHQRLTEEVVDRSVASAWAAWEAACATLLPSPGVVASFETRALALARIESHYFVAGGFMPEAGLLSHMASLAGIPAHIVHGRYDMVCPVEQAWTLHQAWPGSQLTVVPDAGHSATEPGLQRALVAAVAGFAAAGETHR